MRRWYGKQRWECKRIASSNSFILETPEKIQLQIRNHTDDQKKGRGCFTVTAIPKKTFVGVYPGIICNEKQLSMKLGGMSFDAQERVQQYLVQSRIHSTTKSNCYIDPTNTTTGHIHASFADNPILYINEPSVGEITNVYHIWNYDTDRLEIWTSRDIPQSAELLVSYGTSYMRQYETSASAAAPNQTCIIRDGQMQWVAE